MINSIETTDAARHLNREDLQRFTEGEHRDIVLPVFNIPARYLKLPQPPLLSMDEVTEIIFIDQAAKKGVIQTHVCLEDSPLGGVAGRVSPGIMVESLQSCLILAACLNLDIEHAGAYRYRLLEGEVKWLASLPMLTDQLTCKVTLSGRFNVGSIYIYHVAAECWCGDIMLMTARAGRLMFDIDPDRSRSMAPSNFVVAAASPSTKPLAHSGTMSQRQQFSAEDVAAFSEGHAYRCFGKGFEQTRWHQRSPRIPAGMMRMMDAVEAFDPKGGPWKRGYLRGFMAVTRDKWFFPRHFEGDPCMPSSLMLDGGFQLMSFYLAACGFTIDRDGWVFEPSTANFFKYKSKDEITPDCEDVHFEIFVHDLLIIENAPTLRADFSCSAAGRRVFYAWDMEIRLTNDPLFRPISRQVAASDGSAEVLPLKNRPAAETEDDMIIDINYANWLYDHRPVYGVPTFPLAYTLDLIASAAHRVTGGQKIIGLQNVHAMKWIIAAPDPVKIRTRVTMLDHASARVVLAVWREARNPKLSRYEDAASATVSFAPQYPSAPQPITPPPDLKPVRDPYTAEWAFHGPAFQKVRQMSMSRSGSLTICDASEGIVPIGILAPALIDAALHGLPNHKPRLWCHDIGDNFVSFPSNFDEVQIFGPTPGAGEVTCIARFGGYDGDRLITQHVDIVRAGTLWMRFRLTMRLFDLGPLGKTPSDKRRLFLQRQHVPGVGLSRMEGDITRLRIQDVQCLAFLPGTIADVYAIPMTEQHPEWQIAIKEHVGHREGVHPSEVDCRVDESPEALMSTLEQLCRRFRIDVQDDGKVISIIDHPGHVS